MKSADPSESFIPPALRRARVPRTVEGGVQAGAFACLNIRRARSQQSGRGGQDGEGLRRGEERKRARHKGCHVPRLARDSRPPACDARLSRVQDRWTRSWEVEPRPSL